MSIELMKGMDRNTQAHIVHLNDHTLYFSYKTCIAYSGPLGRFRLDNVWGPNTGRHINEMGLREWRIVSAEAMDKTLSKI